MFRAVKLVAAAVAGVGGSFVGGGLYITTSINARRRRWYTDRYHLNPENMRMPFTALTFHPRDRTDIELEGWIIPQTRGGSPSDRVVVLNNPYNSDKSNLLGLAQDLWDAGYTVFMYDFRSHARNGSVRQSIGHLEQQDALAALDTAREKFPNAAFAVIGASMGGAVALMTADKSPRVVGVATDCAFASLDDIVRGKLRMAVPSWCPDWLLHIAMLSVPFWSETFYGYDVRDVCPEEKVKNFTLPLLVIHSQEDELIPVSHAFRIYDNAGTPRDLKERWIIEGANHIGGYFGHRSRYSRRILQFLDAAFDRHLESIRKKEMDELEKQVEKAQEELEQAREEMEQEEIQDLEAL